MSSAAVSYNEFGWELRSFLLDSGGDGLSCGVGEGFLTVGNIYEF